jgi:hypothetical protein
MKNICLPDDEYYWIPVTDKPGHLPHWELYRSGQDSRAYLIVQAGAWDYRTYVCCNDPDDPTAEYVGPSYDTLNLTQRMLEIRIAMGEVT